MKRILPIFLLLCLLSGCTLLEPITVPTVATQPAPTAEATEPTTAPTAPPAETTVPTAPSTGWQTDAGGSYYLDESGGRLSGWQTLGGQQYYFDEDGYCLTGWQTLDQILYYFLEDGTMARGPVQIDGVTRHFTSAGAYVVVVNPWNAVPEDYPLELVKLSTQVAVEDSYVHADCLEAMTQMIQDCNRLSGSNVCVVSAYRSIELQQSNFDRKVNSYLQAGYSEADAHAAAASVIAVPGTSEHHLGLAADIVDTHNWGLVEEQAELPGQQWLMTHCHEYGFILRYPKDKTDVTGIIYEPWHYRYVGVELATELTELGLTMEEYMASLSQ